MHRVPLLQDVVRDVLDAMEAPRGLLDDALAPGVHGARVLKVSHHLDAVARRDDTRDADLPGELLGHAHLVNLEAAVARNDGAHHVLSALAHQVAANAPTLLRPALGNGHGGLVGVREDADLAARAAPDDAVVGHVHDHVGLAVLGGKLGGLGDNEGEALVHLHEDLKEDGGVRGTAPRATHAANLGARGVGGHGDRPQNKLAGVAVDREADLLQDDMVGDAGEGALDVVVQVLLLDGVAARRLPEAVEHRGVSGGLAHLEVGAAALRARADLPDVLGELREALSGHAHARRGQEELAAVVAGNLQPPQEVVTVKRRLNGVTEEQGPGMTRADVLAVTAGGADEATVSRTHVGVVNTLGDGLVAVHRLLVSNIDEALGARLVAIANGKPNGVSRAITHGAAKRSFFHVASVSKRRRGDEAGTERVLSLQTEPGSKSRGLFRQNAGPVIQVYEYLTAVQNLN